MANNIVSKTIQSGQQEQCYNLKMKYKSIERVQEQSRISNSQSQRSITQQNNNLSILDPRKAPPPTFQLQQSQMINQHTTSLADRLKL